MKSIEGLVLCALKYNVGNTLEVVPQDKEATKTKYNFNLKDYLTQLYASHDRCFISEKTQEVLKIMQISRYSGVLWAGVTSSEQPALKTGFSACKLPFSIQVVQTKLLGLLQSSIHVLAML